MEFLEESINIDIIYNDIVLPIRPDMSDILINDTDMLIDEFINNNYGD